MTSSSNQDGNKVKAKSFGENAYEKYCHAWALKVSYILGHVTQYMADRIYRLPANRRAAAQEDSEEFLERRTQYSVCSVQCEIVKEFGKLGEIPQYLDDPATGDADALAPEDADDL